MYVKHLVYNNHLLNDNFIIIAIIMSYGLYVSPQNAYVGILP